MNDKELIKTKLDSILFRERYELLRRIIANKGKLTIDTKGTWKILEGLTAEDMAEIIHKGQHYLAMK